MILAQRNSSAVGGKIAAMSIYNEDSIGRRIKWARKNVEWVDSDGIKHVGMNQHQLGRRLVTPGTMSGVRNVYVSQMEGNSASPSLPMICKIAEVTGVTVGFLLMETDYPYRDKPEPEPVYFSPEADTVAQLIDAAPPEERARIVAVVRALAGSDMPEENRPDLVDDRRKKRVTSLHDDSFTQRLIHRDKVGQPQAGERARS